MLDQFINPIEGLKRDQREAAKELTTTEVRYLVDLYYQIQEFRKASGNQIIAMEKDEEPVALLSWSFGTMMTIEKEIIKWMDIYTDVEESGMGRWCKSIVGIGPVLSAGLLAHIDITKAASAGNIWSFAGLSPLSKWSKGQRRPWNADLKVLCYKIGESFVKVQNNPKDIYGKLFAQRRAEEERLNNEGANAERAKQILTEKDFRKDTTAKAKYSAGKFPDAHLHARARRWAVKIFLSHYHEEAYRRVLKQDPPEIYAVAHLNHVHKIECPRLVE